MSPILVVCLLSSLSTDMVQNGAFEKSLDLWDVHTKDAHIDVLQAEDGRMAARVSVATDAVLGYPQLYQTFEISPGEMLEATVEARSTHAGRGYGAYIAIDFMDSSGKRLGYVQSEPASTEGVWSRLRVRGQALDNSKFARLALIFNGQGDGFFTNASMKRIASPADLNIDEPITVAVTNEIACESLIGFGFEDDGWFYNPDNAAKGVNESDAVIREQRIRWLNPSYVRMFVWHKDYCPTADWQSFTFDSPNMQSHYRTLDIYQKLGARVNLTGVEWGIADPHGDSDKHAFAVGELLETLIRTHGYTCIKDYTLTNEPNTSFSTRYTFDQYVRLHQALASEFARRKLDVSLVGSDDTSGLPWFEQCVSRTDYYDIVGSLCSHRYRSFLDNDAAPEFFESRLKRIAERSARKPLVIGEFGFHDARSSVNRNPIMESYPYALWTAAFAIEGLNQGVAGFSIWALHEVYYPCNMLMNYALWDFKDRGWKPRPVYHAWAMFCRFARAGDNVYRCVSSNPEAFSAARVGDYIFWTNLASNEANVRFAGVQPFRAHIMTESTLHGDRDCGTVQTIETGRFIAPPRSFGYGKIDLK